MESPDLASDNPLFDTLVVQHRGRLKPFLSLSQELSVSLTGRAQPNLPGLGKISGRQLILSLWLQPDGWQDQPCLLVDDARLRAELALPAKERLFSARQLSSLPRLRELDAEARAAKAADPLSAPPALALSAQAVLQRLAIFSSCLSGQIFSVIPPSPESPAGSPWTALRPSAELDPTQIALLQKSSLPSPAKIQGEVLYLRYHPFRLAWLFWLFGALALAFSRAPTGSLHRWGWRLVLLSFFFLIAGFATRIWIAGRPPVTNMYESILWLAFGAALFAVYFSLRYRSTVYLLAAAPVVILSLVASDLQPAVMSPAFNPLVPVLRSNFWLTIHVLTVTLSYAAFALGAALGHFLVVRSLRSRSLPGSEDPLVQHLYRCLQIGVLLLATGVILGGVWANYSWGRFWDWDPKETWSLIALLAYLILLHGRLGGWWGGYGLAVGSIACFLTILMAWYGVNFVLGKGLHSYGFGAGGQIYVGAFVFLEIAFLAIASIRRPARSTSPSSS